MISLRRTVLVTALSLLALASFSAVAHADLYWAEAGAVGHSTNSGGGANGSWLALPDATDGGITADATYIYVTGWNGQIWRAKRDGTDLQQIVTGAANPTSLTTDGTYLYWTSGTSNAIGRAPIAGGTVDNAFIATGPTPSGIVVIGDQLFWSNQSDRTIGRANLDGTDVTNTLITGINSPRGLATDGTYLYWASFRGLSVGRANPDGTGVNRTFFDIGYSPNAIAISGGALYWVEEGFGDIGRLNLTTGSSTYVYDDGMFISGIVATGPGFAASPTTAAFGNQNVGTSATQTFTITNQDAGPATDALTFAANAITFTGTNADQFAKTADTCSGQTIARGASCTVTVRFAPTSTGAKSANLRLVDNAATSPQTFALSGRGTQGAFAAAPETLDFGGVAVGQTGTPATVTVTNTAGGANAGTVTIPAGGVTLTGADAGQFTITADGCAGQTLAPAATCTVEVAAAPTSPGAKSAALRFADDAAGAPHTVALAAIGRAPAVDVDPSVLDFGGVLASRTSPARTLTITNSASGAGADDLVFGAGAVTLAGADADRFAITADGCSGATLAPGAGCTVDVRFAPGTTGPKTALLRLADNAPGSPQEVALIGTGTQPGFAVSPATHAFGDVAVGDAAAAQTFTVTNDATGPSAAPLSFGGGAVTLAGAAADDYVLTADGCSGQELAPGATCDVTVQFVPTARGVRLAQLRFSDDGPASPQGVALTGTGLAPVLALSPARWNAGAVTVGSDAGPATFTLSNAGDAASTLPAPAASVTGTGFAVTRDACAGRTLAPDDTCSVDVAFTPAGPGPASGTLTVGGQTAPLSGAGTASGGGGGGGGGVVVVEVPSTSAPSAGPGPAPAATDASPSPSPAAGGPVVGIRVASKLVRVDGRPAARLALRCLGPRGRRCVGTATVSGARRAVGFRLATGTRGTVRIPLRRAVGCRPTRATVTLKLRQPTGEVGTRRVVVRLRAARCA